MSIRARLETIASNLWWTWNPHAAHLFERLNPDHWERSNHSLLAVLNACDDDTIQRTYDEDALADLDRVLAELHRYLGTESTWVSENASRFRRGLVAYFCAEFGIHESLPLYSGGLGVLAGDHVKTASDLGVPFVAIGLKYPEGYFEQSVDADGMQQETYPATQWHSIPARLVAPGGVPMLVDIPLADRMVYARVWRMDVGRSILYLLDTGIPENNEDDRNIGGRLYSGGSETRIRQEVILGVGGVRLLRALQLEPTTFHLNEGHSAFACLELMRERVVCGASSDEAMAWVRERTLFTTHTPVPAGHDRFDPDLTTMVLWQLQRALGISREALLALGREDPGQVSEPFCMTVLAMKCSGHCNGVSALHGAVSRTMWRAIWPGWQTDDIPIGHVTNGIHVETFLHPIARERFTSIRKDWASALLDQSAWVEIIDALSDGDITDLKRQLKLDMFRAIKRRLHILSETLGPDAQWASGAIANWRTDTLTVGFARRFATYKRGAMLFEDLERAIRLLADLERPVQLLFAGKAHPADNEGKKVIQRVLQAARSAELKGRVIFLENYDMGVARAMISGVDVWLNTPRRPREASGTSGQKVNMHGGVNASILDGWWAEGYDGANGFAIGDTEVPTDPSEQDRRDTAALYEVLESELIPAYYADAPGGTSASWVARMRASMATLPGQFSSRRMFRDYMRNYYIPIYDRTRTG